MSWKRSPDQETSSEKGLPESRRRGEPRYFLHFPIFLIGKVLPVGNGASSLHFEAIVDLFSREICQEWPSLLSQIEK